MNNGSVLAPEFRSLFSKVLHCTHQQNLPKGKSLHAHIIKTGAFTSSTFLANSIINLYAKCHRLAEAHLAFQEIQLKDVVSWNCIISGFSQQGLANSSRSVLNLFQQMRWQNILPNSHTFTCVFSSTAALEDPFAAKQVHSMAIKLGRCLDVFVNSSLLNSYCKSGNVDEGRKVFDAMTEKNSVPWATMISGYASEGSVEEVLKLFKILLSDEKEEANEFILTSVLSAFTLPGFVDFGKQIHCFAVKNGLLSIVSVCNAVITMYTKCGSVDDALQAFELSSDKNSITWSAMITGYAQSGEGEKALKLFSQMHFHDMKPSEYTLVGVLNACSDVNAVSEGKQVHAYVLKLGFEPQMYIMTALVDMYAKCGSIDDARRGFDYLQKPDVVLWTSMIGGYVQNGENESAMNLYCRMQMEGIIPNELTMASVLKACSSLAALEQGKQIHGLTIKYGFSLEIPIGSAVLTMYAKCGSLDDGNLVFRRMPARDVVSWNSMISGLSRNGRGIEALNLFYEMRSEGVKPDCVTFLNILSACSHMGLVERGWSYFKMMSVEFNLVPMVEHYSCMVDILGRAGKLHEAKEFIESVTIDHGLCLWRILLSASCNYHNYDVGAYAGEKIMDLGSQESSAYVLLTSIYKALGKQNDVERVRRMMRLRGINKEPGCSWIEIKSQTHAFVVGDLLHPQISDIREEVLRLSKLMKDEGYQPDFYPIVEEFQD